jgi:hypothetical protein
MSRNRAAPVIAAHGEESVNAASPPAPGRPSQKALARLDRNGRKRTLRNTELIWSQVQPASGTLAGWCYRRRRGHARRRIVLARVNRGDQAQQACRLRHRQS